jgi:hypothetical protein
MVGWLAIIVTVLLYFSLEAKEKIENVLLAALYIEQPIVQYSTVMNALYSTISCSLVMLVTRLCLQYRDRTHPTRRPYSTCH